MAYQLNIRRGQSEVEDAAVFEAFRAALAEGKGELTGDADRGWEWLYGETRCTLAKATREDGTPLGADIEVPYGATVEEVGACLQRILSSAAQPGLLVFDPQLGDPVGSGDVGRIIEKFEQASSYHVNLAGTAEDLRQGIATAEEGSPYKQPGASIQVKVLLGIVILFAVAYLIFRACIVAPLVDQLQGFEPQSERPGPPPGWVARHPPPLPVDGEGDRGADGEGDRGAEGRPPGPDDTP